MKAVRQRNLCQSCGRKTNKKVCNICVGLVLKPIIEAERKAKEDKRKAKINAHESDYKTALQNEINKLSKLIDFKFGLTDCIDCGKFLNKETHQIDACHFISRKKNSTLKYNLLILHSGHNHCNTRNETHESSYKIGLEKRYGKEILEEIEGLSLKYPIIKLTAFEAVEKLKLVRKIIRTFDTFQFENSLAARKQLNLLIGIYV
jgi:Bacteriophage Lambda NinG protein